MAVIAAWAFPSSSGSTTYETTLDAEGALSCNCPGFLFKKKDQKRGCKHTRQIAPYMDRVLAGGLTADQVGTLVGVSSATSLSPSAPSASTTPPPSACSPRKERLIDFEE